MGGAARDGPKRFAGARAPSESGRGLDSFPRYFLIFRVPGRGEHSLGSQPRSRQESRLNKRPTNSAPSTRLLNVLWIASLGLCLAIFALGVLGQFSSMTLQDDSFMFYRYAYRLAVEHRLSWNPQGEPTYGLTAMGYLAAVLPIFLLFPSQPALTVCLASFVSGIVFLMLLVVAVERHCKSSSGLGRGEMLLLAFTIAASVSSLAHHFTSGMDTTFSMAFAMSYILLAAEFERRVSRSRALLLGFWGGLAFTARPDLMLFSCLIPASLVWFAADSLRRRLAVLVLATTVGVVALQAALFSRFLHSPLPLPFYAKSMRLYDDFIYQVYATTPRIQLMEFGRLHIHLIAIITGCLLLNFRSWWSRSSAVDKGLLAAGILFVSYYYFFVLQILGGWERFYYPVLPALAYLACRCLQQVAADWLPPFDDRWPWRKALAFGMLAGMISLSPLLVVEIGELRAVVRSGEFARFDLQRFARLDRWQRTWVGLDQFSTLPDDLVIATTEVGLPGAMNLRKTIIDMAGLQDTSFAHTSFSADRLFSRDRPDLIYMPHTHYKRITREVEDHQVFKEDYEFFPPQRFNANFGVAVRKDSPYYSPMHSILSGIPPLPPDPSSSTGPSSQAPVRGPGPEELKVVLGSRQPGGSSGLSR